MRKLVRVDIIRGLNPILGADKIELATVEGWKVIVKKDEFKVGDKCVFFEVDSFLPLRDEWSFLKNVTMFDKQHGIRIKTMKMRGVLSQGLIMPLSLLNISQDTEVGTNLTDVLGVVKYEVLDSGDFKSINNKTEKYPSFLPKTGQPRIQNATEWFDRYSEEVFEETLKLDGSSMSVAGILEPIQLTRLEKIKNFFGANIPTTKYVSLVCSRNVLLERPISNDVTQMNNYWRAFYKFGLDRIPAGFCVQGELLAPNIQCNHEKVKSVEFYVFDVFDITKQEYLTPTMRKTFLDLYLEGVYYAPVVASKIKALELGLDGLLERVKGESMNKGVVSEGRVYKSILNPEIHFKVINNDYLLKEK